jgi:hypothetical protein
MAQDIVIHKGESLPVRPTHRLAPAIQEQPVRYLVTIKNLRDGTETTFEAFDLTLKFEQGRHMRGDVMQGFTGEERYLVKAWRGCKDFDSFVKFRQEDPHDTSWKPAPDIELGQESVKTLPHPTEVRDDESLG